MGKHMISALKFYSHHEVWGFAPFWSGYKKNDRATRNAIESLVSRGYLEVNEHNMAHVTTKGLDKAKKLLLY